MDFTRQRVARLGYRLEDYFHDPVAGQSELGTNWHVLRRQAFVEEKLNTKTLSKIWSEHANAQWATACHGTKFEALFAIIADGRLKPGPRKKFGIGAVYLHRGDSAQGDE
jgi:hypothetical protein